MQKVTKIFCVGVGGQGNILMGKMLGDALVNSNINVVMSEIHGMAQRGGIVETTIVYGDAKGAIISDGDADILIGFEPLETFRAINKCSKKTVVITNTHPILPFTVTIGQGKYIDVGLALSEMEKRVEVLHAIDAFEIAAEIQAVKSINVVMLGFLAGLDILPVSKDVIWSAIEQNLPPKLHKINRKAFEEGHNKVKSQKSNPKSQK